MLVQMIQKVSHTAMLMGNISYNNYHHFLLCHLTFYFVHCNRPFVINALQFHASSASYYKFDHEHSFPDTNSS